LISKAFTAMFGMSPHSSHIMGALTHTPRHSTFLRVKRPSACFFVASSTNPAPHRRWWCTSGQSAWVMKIMLINNYFF
jgi:hypothetical protein